MIPRRACDIDSQLMFEEPKTRGLHVNNYATALPQDKNKTSGQSLQTDNYRINSSADI